MTFWDQIKGFLGFGEKKLDPYRHKCHDCGHEHTVYRRFADGKVICIDCASGRGKNAAS